nr:hypothetical protein BaRGS_000721 [Batillaria attramentaria]
MRVIPVSVRVGFSSLRFEPIHEIGPQSKLRGASNENNNNNKQNKTNAHNQPTICNENYMIVTGCYYYYYYRYYYYRYYYYCYYYYYYYCYYYYCYYYYYYQDLDKISHRLRPAAL